MKRIVAVLFAAMIAAVLLFGLILIGVNAWVNPGSVPPSNSPAALASLVTFLPPSAIPTGVTLGWRRPIGNPSLYQNSSSNGLTVDRAVDFT